MRLLILLIGLTLTSACVQAEDVQQQRTISVGGVGEIEAVPDAATVPMAIEARHKNLQSARQQVDETVASFLNLTDELEIDRKHVKTAGMNVRPEYRWEEKTRKRYLDGYVVTRQLEVDLRDLDKLGALMTRAVQAGINEVSSPQFRATNERELRREALAKAAKDARANAQVLAESMDVKLGEVRTLDAQYDMHSPPPMPRVAAMRMESADMAAAEQSYETGQIRFKARVSASFDLR